MLEIPIAAAIGAGHLGFGRRDETAVHLARGLDRPIAAWRLT
jgi:hypothetical protein